MDRYDVAVLGLGAMGSAAADHLARRGARVLGLEQFTPVHDRGSSHGKSRIIRMAYFEHPAYVPLLRRAYELWHELEATTGRELLVETGGLMLGRPDSQVVRGALQSAREHDLRHQILDAAELRHRYSMFQVADDEIAIHEGDAGVLFPEDCIVAHLERATAHRAELHFETPVARWRPTDQGVEVRTATGVSYADRLVVTAGSWAGRILADLGLPLEPERNVIYWFEPLSDAEAFRPPRFPIFIWERPERVMYGLPDLRGEGVKVAFHHSGEIVGPDRVRRAVGEDEIAAIRAGLAQRLPILNGALRGAATCLYTNTPDGHFAIGIHPRHPRVVLAAGFSGHGFKFASVVGEILADLALAGRTRHPIGLFDLERFQESVVESEREDQVGR